MAQAILLADVDDLGARGEAVDVSPGYLRNFLIPRKLAQPATPGDTSTAPAAKKSSPRALFSASSVKTAPASRRR